MKKGEKKKVVRLSLGGKFRATIWLAGNGNYGCRFDKDKKHIVFRGCKELTELLVARLELPSDTRPNSPGFYGAVTKAFDDCQLLGVSTELVFS